MIATRKGVEKLVKELVADLVRRLLREDERVKRDIRDAVRDGLSEIAADVGRFQSFNEQLLERLERLFNDYGDLLEAYNDLRARVEAIEGRPRPG